MRFPDKRTIALHTLILSGAMALSACAGGPPPAPAVAPDAMGPAADYPVVLGEPFTVNGVTYTPEDRLNYDQVGRVAVDPALGNGAFGAHRMLPLPSYVEVTSLENGRTVLIRLTQRGPMTGDAEIALSPATAARIELSPGSPVRVRRVNPPEFERAQLRRGEMAAERIETPMGLVQVLLRKLPEAGTPQAEAAPAGPQSIEVPASAAMPSANPVEDLDTPPPADTPAQSATAEPEPAPPAPAVQGNLIVQAAAFSTQERAQKAAESLGGTVSQAGQYWRVRTGPFATQAEAQASLAKVKAAGYSDARIQTID